MEDSVKLCSENLIEEIINSSAEIFNKDVSELNFLNNNHFRKLLFERCNGDENEMKSMIFASIMNYADNPLAIFEDGKLLFGSEVNAMDKETLVKFGAITILNMAGSYSAEFLEGTNIKYKSIQINDTENEILPIGESVNFIKEAIGNGNTVLVHCIEGRSRSGSIIIAYFMDKYKWTYEQAIEYVRKQRYAMPNVGFKNQLVNFQLNS
jgi:hypothetical protein